MTLRDLRALARDLAGYNSGIRRARAAYAAEPNACTDWCRTCIRPIARANRCAACNETLRLRARDRRTKP